MTIVPLGATAAGSALPPESLVVPLAALTAIVLARGRSRRVPAIAYAAAAVFAGAEIVAKIAAAVLV